MKIRLTRLLLFVLFLLTSPACGVLEIGFEEFSPQRTATQLPSLKLPPTITLPPPTETPVPSQLNPGQSVRITRIEMRDKSNGWGIGQVETDPNDYILYTDDGGRSWQDRTPYAALHNPPSQGLAATAFFGESGLAWVIYASPPSQPKSLENPVLWRTSDYGRTWQAGESLALTDIQTEFFIPDKLGFFDESHGWLLAHIGGGVNRDDIAAFTTTDGGQSWQRIIDPQKNPDLMNCRKTGLAFSTAANGWLTGNCPGPILFSATRDSGQTWQPITLLPPLTQPSDLFTSSKAGCGIPDLPFVTSRLMMLTVRCDFYDTKRSAAWLYVGQEGSALEARPLPLPFGTLQFISAEEGWLVGAAVDDWRFPGEIYHTIDAGVPGDW